jgi:arginyl-tRNA synthetase
MSEQEQNEFEKYEREVIASVEAVQKKIKEERENRKYLSFGNYESARLRAEIVSAIKESTGTRDVGEIELTPPPPHVFGDFALDVFDLAKKLKEKPEILVEKIVSGLKLKAQKNYLIKDAFAVGAFVNIETHKEKLYRDVLSQILELKERYGENDINAGRIAVIDYSAPNIAKPIGVGHLRSTIIGQALANVYQKTGYIVIKDNHLGDWGTQFGALIYAYQEWGDEKKIIVHPIGELKDLYVRFHKFAEEHKEAKDSARELFARLEKKDPELVALWKRFRDLSLRDFERVYKKLDVEFDTNIGESYFTESANKLVDECLEKLSKDLCHKDDVSEAVIVEQMGDIPSFLLRKQDGTSLYLSRDLATLDFRIKTFHPHSILYVVGDEQNLNFRQLFALAGRMGYLDNTEAKHINFGMVLRDGKKMSTREGTLIELEELISQSVNKSKEILIQKNPDTDLREAENVSEIVGIGAIIYNDLRQSRIKNISFDWGRMLDLEGGSAVYLQYSYVRINSILRKLAEVYGEIGVGNLKESDIFFEHQSEFVLAKKLLLYPEIIVKTQKTDSPHHIAVYLEELASLFNSFYDEISIIKTEDLKLRASRAALCRCVALVIKAGLGLLNIKVPERM